MCRRRCESVAVLCLVVTGCIHPVAAMASDLPAWMQTINRLQESRIGRWVSNNGLTLNSINRSTSTTELFRLHSEQIQLIEDSTRSQSFDAEASERSFNVRMKELLVDQMPGPVAMAIKGVEASADVVEHVKGRVDEINRRAKEYVHSARYTFGEDLTGTIDWSDEERRTVLSSLAYQEEGLSDAAVSEIVEFERVHEGLQPEQIYFRDPTNDGYFEQRVETYGAHQEDLTLPTLPEANRRNLDCYEIMPGWSVRGAQNAAGFETCSQATSGTTTLARTSPAEPDQVILAIGEQECRSVSSGNYKWVECGSSVGETATVSTDKEPIDPPSTAREAAAGAPRHSQLERQVKQASPAGTEGVLPSVKDPGGEAAAQGLSNDRHATPPRPAVDLDAVYETCRKLDDGASIASCIDRELQKQR
jgi:hypothetical protein